MKPAFFVTAAAGLFAASMALADAFSDALIADLQGQGFTRIEIKNGPTQTKAEAMRGDTKIEVVYDRSTGRIIKQEQERVRTGEDMSQGVSVRTRSEDFVDASGDGSSGDDSSSRTRSRSDDSGSDDRGERGSDDRGEDDHGSDDRGGDDRGSDDDDDRGHNDDDHGGRDDNSGHDHDDDDD